MRFEHYIYNGTERLRCGYTTGSCAALAAQAATTLLLTGVAPATAAIDTPAGLPVQADVLEATLIAETARCAVRKDAGDDYDVTDGLLIVVEVKRAPDGLRIEGGEGVGRVTKPGLEQPVGAAAINSVPRQMITQAVLAVCRQQDYTGGLSVTISIPEGEQMARKTFNPNLGIEGGISIIGTTGIVEPKSLSALLDSIELEIGQQAALGAHQLILTPGNYGQAFIATYPRLRRVPLVSCANFIGEALDFAARYNFRQVLFVGHIGKLVKLAGGIMNTHSRLADCRAELISAHAALCGAQQSTVAALMRAATTDAALDILQQAALLQPVLSSLITAIDGHLQRRVAGAYEIGAVLFSNQRGLLGQTGAAAAIMRTMEENYE